MRTEMSKAEAITRIDRFLSYLEKIYTPQCDCEEALIRMDDITAFVIARDALKEQRPHGEWVDKIYDVATCSKCSYRGGNFHNFNFCPNCGASMKKDGE